jgi:hypothetical protein
MELKASVETNSTSKNKRGIHDILSKLNIYRPDLIPSDLSVSQYPALDNIKRKEGIT